MVGLAENNMVQQLGCPSVVTLVERRLSGIDGFIRAADEIQVTPLKKSGNPVVVGVRGSIPALEGASSWARVWVEYYSSADGAWHPVPAGGDSGWFEAGGPNEVVETIRGHDGFLVETEAVAAIIARAVA